MVACQSLLEPDDPKKKVGCMCILLFILEMLLYSRSVAGQGRSGKHRGKEQSGNSPCCILCYECYQIFSSILRRISGNAPNSRNKLDVDIWE